VLAKLLPVEDLGEILFLPSSFCPWLYHSNLCLYLLIVMTFTSFSVYHSYYLPLKRYLLDLGLSYIIENDFISKSYAKTFFQVKYINKINSKNLGHRNIFWGTPLNPL
jgi:hypothetical protein